MSTAAVFPLTLHLKAIIHQEKLSMTDDGTALAKLSAQGTVERN